MTQVYKKTGTCSRPSGAQTDYPMYLVVGESAGALGTVNFAPTNMTANNSPSPYVTSASSEESSSFQAYAAFQGGVGLGQYWVGTGGWSGGFGSDWLKIDMGANAKSLASYSIQVNTVPEPTRAPKAWTLHGSNNDSDWTLLDTVTGQTSWSSGQIRNYVCDDGQQTVYRYLRWTFSENNGANRIQVAEIYLYSCIDCHCDAHCKPDFGDIRFHNAADAALNYMIDWGTLTGTTPNQSVGVWVATDPETSDTDVVLKYGDATLTDASTSAIFIKRDDFERGSNADELGGDWTGTGGTCEISTTQAYSGTRSAKFKAVAGVASSATIPLTAGTGYAIRAKCFKTAGADNFYPMSHGNGTSLVLPMIDGDGNIKYHDADNTLTDTGYDAVEAAWFTLECCNINFTAGTYSISYNDTIIAADIEMRTAASLADVVRIYNYNPTAGNDAYVDDFIVRKYANPEPTWGTWGAEVEIGSTPTGPSGIKAFGPTASASIKAYGPTAWGSVKAL